MVTATKGKTRPKRKNTDKKPADDVVRLPAQTVLGKEKVTCAGNVCFTEDGNIVIDLTGSACPPSAVREVAERTFQCASIMFKVGKSSLSDKDFNDLGDLGADLLWIDEKEQASERLKLSKEQGKEKGK